MSTNVNIPTIKWDTSPRSPRKVSASKRDLYLYNPNGVSAPTSVPLTPYSTPTSSTPKTSSPAFVTESTKSCLGFHHPSNDVFVHHSVSENSTPRKNFLGRQRARSNLTQTTPLFYGGLTKQQGTPKFQNELNEKLKLREKRSTDVNLNIKYEVKNDIIWKRRPPLGLRSRATHVIPNSSPNE
ncbi:Uncharacterized protein QTN25_003429 [Entamoeba marina]